MQQTFSQGSQTLSSNIAPYPLPQLLSCLQCRILGWKANKTKYLKHLTFFYFIQACHVNIAQTKTFWHKKNVLKIASIGCIRKSRASQYQDMKVVEDTKLFFLLLYNSISHVIRTLQSCLWNSLLLALWKCQ